MSKEQIQGYIITKELSNEHSGFAKWGFAKKGGNEYFIKEFLSPTWPEKDSPISEAQKQTKINECIEWNGIKHKVYNAVRSAENGNIIYPHEFFRDGSHYYIVTDKVDTASLPLAAVARLPYDKQILILKVFAHCLMKLAEAGVTHSDLKPDNLLIKETVAGTYTVKLIDFDSGYLESDPPGPDDIQCDPTYMAPEVFLYMIEEEATVGTKSDIFSAGIIFHEYLCNELPKISDEYSYIYESVLDGVEPVISPKIPSNLHGLLRSMLNGNYDERIDAEGVFKALVGDKKEEPVPEAVTPAPYVPINDKEKIPTNDMFRVSTDDDW